MIQDRQNLVSIGQDLAQAAGTYVSTDAVFLGTPGTPAVGGSLRIDPGGGQPLQAWVQVIEAFESLGAATLQVRLVQADNAALTSNKEVLLQSPAIALATLVAGYQFRLGTIPAGVTRPYLGYDYIIGTAAMTAGTISAGFTTSRQTNPTV